MNARIAILGILLVSPFTVLAGQDNESFGLEKLLEKAPAVAEQIRPTDALAAHPSLVEYRASQASKPISPEPSSKPSEDAPVDWKQMREAAFQAMGLGENRKVIQAPAVREPAEDPLKIPLVVSQSARDRLVASALVPSKGEIRLAQGSRQLSSLARKGYASARASTNESAFRAHKAGRSAPASGHRVGYATVQE